MDVHRCRFVLYPPSAINALAISPFPKGRQKKNTPRLAVGRANGDIELWNPLNGAWLHETTLRGGKDRSIEALAWTQDPEETNETGEIVSGKIRLFSTGYSTVVTEWDLEKGVPARHSPGGYGSIWCLAAQPRLMPSKAESAADKAASEQGVVAAPSFQKLAVGCDDGSIVLLSTADGDLSYSQTLSRPPFKRTRVLSITFQSRDILMAGYADSAIRVYDIRSGQLLRNISLGAAPAGGSKEILVWALKCLNDGTIVSGDSAGEIRVWDGKNYSLRQRIHSHEADVLCLAVKEDGNTIISGGMDRRTTVYRKMASRNVKRSGKWVELAHKRYHENDVRALATLEWGRISVIVSGGLDTHPVVVPLREFGNENHRPLSNLPLKPPVCSVPQKRLLMSWWDREINIWSIIRGPKAQLKLSSYDNAKNHKIMSKILLKGEENLMSAAITPDGRLIAAATVSGIKIFEMREKREEQGISLRVKTVECPDSLRLTGAKSVAWSPNSQWLAIVRLDNSVQVFKVVAGDDVVVHSQPITLEAIRTEPTSRATSTFGAYLDTVTSITFSTDSDIVVAGLLSGSVDSWVLVDVQESEAQKSNASESESESDEEEEEEEKVIIQHQTWVPNPKQLPQLPSALLILSFRPCSRSHKKRESDGVDGADSTKKHDELLVVTSENHIYEFEVLQGQLSAWSRRNPPANLPKRFTSLLDRAMGCVWDVESGRRRIWVYGSMWLWMFDLTEDLPGASQNGKEPGAVMSVKGSSRKRKWEGTAAEAGPSSGAGGKKAAKEIDGTGIGPSLQKTRGPESDAPQVISVGEEEEEEEKNGSDSEMERSLAQLRREEEQPPDNVDDNVDDDVVAKSRCPWWYTFKYRPILGIVPLSGRVNGKKSDNPKAIEVALVERPLVEADVQPRFEAEHEPVSRVV